MLIIMKLINMEEFINTFNMDSKNYLKFHLEKDIIIEFMNLTYFDMVPFLKNIIKKIINLEVDIIITHKDLEHIDLEVIDLGVIDLEDMEDFKIDWVNIINKIHFN